MKIVNIAGRELKVREMGEADWNAYRAFATEQARKLWQYQTIPEKIVDHCAASAESCVWLLIQHCGVGIAKSRDLVAADPQCFEKLRKALSAPTIEDQIAFNEQLKKRLCPSTSNETQSSNRPQT